ncbi:seryl-tRNA synthetase [Dipsacomyces acuminosporus]|nr:seryl-tRNA synthetase [Dipsacomyces acuminosporus]
MWKRAANPAFTSAFTSARQRTRKAEGLSAIYQNQRALVQPSFDYRFIRDHADELLDNARKRNVGDAQPHRVGELYDQFRALTSEINNHRSSLNAISRELGSLSKNMGNSITKARQADRESELDLDARRAAISDLREKAKSVKAAIQGIESQLDTVESRLRYEASRIPNLSHPDTPVGDESHARIVRIDGSLHKIEKVPLDGVSHEELSNQDFKDHYDLALNLGIVDMEAGAKVAGSRFHYWKGAGALLELALVQYAMTRAASAGFTLHITPDVARSSIVDACGFRPRSTAEDMQLNAQMGDAKASRTSGEASQIYRVTPIAEESHEEGSSAADPLCLIATAEIPLVSMKQQRLLDSTELPLSVAGLSHCFRAEAGARGRDTRGIYRLHQFTKVELVSLVLPDQSEAELARLVDFQASLYAALGLTFRVLQMPTHELGASAYQKFDIEAWMPGRKAWGEISSASNCTDYQARRLGIRTRLPAASEGGRSKGNSSSPVFVHTLNATAIAVPRLVVALLESFQRPNGDVAIPAVLRPWMMGMDVLKPATQKSNR